MAEWCANEKIDFVGYRKVFSLNPLVAVQIKKICRSRKISHLHTHDSHAHTFAVLANSLFKLNIPLVVHRRVDFPVKANWRSAWKYNHASVKAIICVSDFIRKLMEPAIQKKEIICTVHSGIDLSITSEKVTDIREEFGIPREHKIIINLSAIAPHKDYFTFVDTAVILLKKGLQATFLLVGGDGGEMTAIRDYIRKCGVQHQLILTGHRNDVPSVLAQADLMLFTSKTEGLGGAVLDALLSGTPVVATAAGGVPEIIDHQKTGLLAPVGNASALAAAVERMFRDPALRNTCIENGKIKATLFSKEKMAEKIINIYRAVANS